MFRRTDMQALSAETLQGLLKNLYPEDSSVDAALLSSQLLQILRGASANDDDAGRTDLWTGADAVLILTEWRQYSDLNWADLAARMRRPAWVFDARAVSDPHQVWAAGLSLWRVGDGEG